MLINLVKHTFLRCFCHSCKAPILPAATEIRCQEKSKGGLSYEVVLSKTGNGVSNVIVPRRPAVLDKNVSSQEIERKLRAAEERRLLLEAKKLAEVSNQIARIQEVSRRKQVINNQFKNQTKEQLDNKMEHHIGKRESIINDIKEKIKVHTAEIEKTRQTLEQQKEKEKQAIEEKLKNAQQSRDDHIKKMLERLKQHERQIESVRQKKYSVENIS
ncbi:STMN1 family protein [Megaselia abdita]